MKKLLLISTLFFSVISNAQTKFLQAGKIEFERKINVHRQVDVKEDDSWYKEFVSKLPRFHTSYFDLYFAEGKTIYKPGRETEDMRRPNWLVGPSKDNIIYNDLSKKEMKSQKSVFEQTYLLLDSAREYEWKISEEVRTIAGFDCRKAVARICDSVYIVAFYTDEITVSGGPESFHGLPGMILGLAVPRLYTTWFATKVELITPEEKVFATTNKGKKITDKELLKTLQSSLKDWGAQGQKNIWWVVL